jgi:hypothetical protein
VTSKKSLYYLNMALNKFTQVALAVIIVLIIMIYGLPVFLRRKVLDDPNDLVGGNKVDVTVITGKLPLNNAELTIHTSIPEKDEYIELPRSKNLDGGAQYSYSFWMNSSSMGAVANKALLLRGQTNRGNIISTKNDTSTNSTAVVGSTKVKVDSNKNMYDTVVSTKTNTVMLKQPMIKFGATQNMFVVSVNTNNNPDEEWNIDASIANAAAPNTYKMYTFTFEDYLAADGFSNGFIMRFYVNAIEISAKTVSGESLRLNDGPLYIFPMWGQTPNELLTGDIADITYYNYALKKHDIKKLVEKGFNDMPATTPGQRKGKNANRNKYYQLSLDQQLNTA